MRITEVIGAQNQAPSHPAVVPTSYIIDLVQQIHHTPEDLGDGDLGNRIWKFLRYELKQLPVQTLRLDWSLGQQAVDEFAGMDASTMPPIVFDPIDKSIIDGSHRVAAAMQRGDPTIWAYVGTDPDPNWSEDERGE